MATRSLQFYFRQQLYLFKFRLSFSLLCLFLFSLCCVLGVWQLHRYAYKKILLTQYSQHSTAKTAPLFSQQASLDNLQFKRVDVQGIYLNQLTMMVQNRFYHDQVGFDVLTPLRIPGEKKLLLIDRGWIKKESAALPYIPPISGKQNLQGYIKLLDEYQFILGKNILEPHKMPLNMQRIDINEISQMTHQAFFPFILRLDPAQPHGFVRDWTITTVIPARHLGYAVQWFALAIVLVIAYFCFCCERKDADTYS